MENCQPNQNSISTRNQTIDFMKGICILFVIITHFSWSNLERNILGFPFWISMAIPIFMLISGYVNTLSFLRKNITGLNEAFSVKNWMKSFIRYTIPYLLIFALEAIIQIILCIIGTKNIPWYDFLSALVSGGWGPGSYYYPILIQFLIIFPFIFKLIHKYGAKGLLATFFINLFWELIKFPFAISYDCYRLLVFRYIFLIGFGCYTAIYGFKNKKVNTISIIGSFVGLAFIIVTQYTKYNTIIFTNWTTTCLIAVLFIIPLFNVIVIKIHKLPKLFKPIEFLGKASYNIFFVQMVFFYFISTTLEKAIGIRSVYYIVTIILCLALGIIFYLIEAPITKKINNIIYKRLDKV